MPKDFGRREGKKCKAPDSGNSSVLLIVRSELGEALSWAGGSGAGGRLSGGAQGSGEAGHAAALTRCGH